MADPPLFTLRRFERISRAALCPAHGLSDGGVLLRVSGWQRLGRPLPHSAKDPPRRDCLPT
ncbi:predicted protein [Streptomyces viridosporus ATCC 14672]|uniref:Predicted protein n=1 Tax=Streptomyces viridosporus (strain ATCC 14672 / DSM 40746 / JCM 4963 / KCTC 9882 / NRRL B-12104 / FH 1290) TaxID=566461 RepID=D6A773_STRV1|nr:predicted protein [Streptomyces viridosporus ATCC 14672]